MNVSLLFRYEHFITIIYRSIEVIASYV